MSQARDFADSFSAVSTGRRNMIINGAMQVWQRGTSSVQISGSGSFRADRFESIESSNGAATHEQSTDAPDGFSTSLELNVTTADTDLGGGQYFLFAQSIEAQNLQHLEYGSSNAKKVTASFWVKSNKTGTYVLEMWQEDAAQYISKTYTIDTANTWEKKTLTFSPNTSTAINNDAGHGLRLHWWLGAGTTYSSGTHNDDTWHSTTADRAAGLSVNWMDSTSNNFYVTGVQLELGNAASPFEHRSYGEELALCQRYYAEGGVILATGTPDRYYTNIALPVSMRVVPTISTGQIDSGSGGGMVPQFGAGGTQTSLHNFYQGSNNSAISSAYFKFDAEL